jgi:hypothetical protein
MMELEIQEMMFHKLEPSHFLLAKIAYSFNGWLLLESLLMILLLIQLLKNKSLLIVALVLWVALPLMSSSFRFALGLTLTLCAYDYLTRKK